MTVNTANPISPAAAPGPMRSGYYALPLRGRLIPYEGGAFADRAETGSPATPDTPEKSVKKQGFSFGALIDIINPLQHIPMISSIYRRITGDEISTVSRFAGGGLFFGVFGLAGALVNVVVKKATGQDVGDSVINAALGKKNADQPDTAIAKTPATETDYRGTVTIIPREDSAPAFDAPVLPPPAHKSRVSRAGALDPATFDALTRTLGSSELIQHLAPNPGAGQLYGK